MLLFFLVVLFVFLIPLLSLVSTYTLSVPQGSQYTTSIPLRKLFASWNSGNPQTNICAYFCAKWRLLLDPSQQGCLWTLRCFYIYSQGVPRLFQNSDTLSTTRPTKVICLQRRNRRLYDRESHSFVGSKSTFPYQRIVYVVLKTTF